MARLTEGDIHEEQMLVEEQVVNGDPTPGSVGFQEDHGKPLAGACPARSPCRRNPGAAETSPENCELDGVEELTANVVDAEIHEDGNHVLGVQLPGHCR